MAVLSANVKNPDFYPAIAPYTGSPPLGTIDWLRGNTGEKGISAVTLPVKSTGIDGFIS
jgi:hypothetical protein